ncbi:hypothetical protein [uncultured Chryseobacterium sp.]|uniref:hypothetical protein n=2 Tax=uncultured Chryseobacterium sp. TaxID=259322 RepID=UPI002583A236|nr:hypothetical protein [uncultured Chryseobacterium sp.]
MMNTKIFVISTMLVGISAFSQEIKIKKGELLLDDKVVAKVEDKKEVYSFSDLNGQPKFSVKVFPTIGTEKGWVEFTGQNGNVKETEFADTGFTLSEGKLIVKNALSQGLLTKDGFDETKVNEFFKTTDRSLTRDRENNKAAQKKVDDNENVLANERGIRIDNSGKIWDKNKELTGFIKRVDLGHNGIFNNYEYRVYDTNQIQIATLSCTNYDPANIQRGMKIITYDNKQSEISVTHNSFSGPLSEDKVADRMVKRLIFNGYTLGDMKSTVVDSVNQRNEAAENQAKANSINIYNTPGYVIDKTGTKKEGNITIEFESLDAKMGREKGMGDLTNYGGSVTLNVEGKNEFFKAKDGVKFCAGERCFIGVAGTDMFGSKFTEILSENNESYVLVNLRTPNYYYLKLADQPKAAYLGEKGDFGTRKPEKMKKIFDEYVNCPAMNFSNYDTTTKDGLIKILDDYQTRCKK